MCDKCIHKAVCSKFIATGGVSRCEHFKEERRGKWVSSWFGHDVCSECRKVYADGYFTAIGVKPRAKFNYCPNCGADMRGCLQEIATAAKPPRNDTEGCGADMRGKGDGEG